MVGDIGRLELSLSGNSSFSPPTMKDERLVSIWWVVRGVTNVGEREDATCLSSELASSIVQEPFSSTTMSTNVEVRQPYLASRPGKSCWYSYLFFRNAA